MFKKTGPHVFETDLEGEHDRALIITIKPYGVFLHGKGTQRTLGISWEAITLAAARNSGEIPGGFLSKPLQWLLRR